MLEPLLPRLKRDIEARLKELQPIVEEAAHLEAARRALLDERAAERSAQPAPAARRQVAARPSAVAVRAAAQDPQAPADADDGARAPRGANRDAILALVEERPGVSVAEIASVTKIPKPTVATTVSKLKRDGVLADEAGGVKLASRKPLTLAEIAAAAARDQGASDEEWDSAQPAEQGAA
jgi:DNA-binding transcriptional ArsR family regulator